MNALAILVLCLAGLCQQAQAVENVQLGFYSESLCPDCIAFANGPLEKAMNEVSEREKEREMDFFSSSDW